MILQAHRDSVRIVISDTKPVLSNTAFHLLGDGDAPLPFPIIDTNVWALSVSDRSSLIVTESSKPLPIGFGDSPSLDGFSRIRTSNPFGIFDNKNIDSRNRNQWEEKMSGVKIGYDTLVGGPFTIGEEVRSDGDLVPLGIITADTGSVLTLDCNHNDFEIGDGLTGQTSGATANVTSTNTGTNIQHNYNKAAVDLTVGTAATDFAIRQTHRYHAYVPGKSQLAFETFKFGPAKENVRKRAGLFDDFNGMYIEQNGTTDVAIVIRSNVSGSPVNNRAVQTDWTIDKMNGSGPSGLTLDFTNGQIFPFDFQWLGMGRVRAYLDIGGILIPVHEFNHSNLQEDVYMRTPTLPIRYEIANLAATASSTTMQEYCSSISSEGGYTLPGLEFSVSTEITPRTVTTTKEPIIAIRLKNEFPAGKPNRRIARFLSSSFMVAINDAHLEVLHVHEPIDIVATWNDVGGGSALEYSTDISSFVGRPTHEIIEEYGPTTQAGKSNARAISADFINLHGFISQSLDSDGSEMFLLSAQSFTGNADISGSLTWLEYV
jgi:hypothetical protein